MEVFIFGNSEIEDLSLLAAVKEGGGEERVNLEDRCDGI